MIDPYPPIRRRKKRRQEPMQYRKEHYDGADGRIMKDILMLRSLLADIYRLRDMAVIAVNERDVEALRDKLTAMKRKIATIEAVLDAAIQA